MKHWLVTAALVAVSACGGSKAPGASRLELGAFTVALPTGWARSEDARLGAGKVLIKDARLIVILEAQPEPLEHDPADEADCAAYAEQLRGHGMDVARSEVITLPAGKACSVEGQATTKSGRTRASHEVVVSAGGHALSAQCTSAEPAAMPGCATIFAAIALRPGS